MLRFNKSETKELRQAAIKYVNKHFTIMSFDAKFSQMVRKVI